MYVKNRTPMYEGDGFIHAGPVASIPPTRKPENSGSIREVQHRARKARGEVIAGLIRSFVAWARRKTLESRSAALDEYLSHSTSLADVERRLREVERNGSFLPG